MGLHLAAALPDGMLAGACGLGTVRASHGRCRRPPTRARGRRTACAARDTRRRGARPLPAHHLAARPGGASGSSAATSSSPLAAAASLRSGKSSSRHSEVMRSPAECAASSRVRSSTRRILPEVVFGSSRTRPCARACRPEVPYARGRGFRALSPQRRQHAAGRETYALVTSRRMSSGHPTTAASATKSCSSSTLSTSNGDTLKSLALKMSSVRPTKVSVAVFVAVRRRHRCGRSRPVIASAVASGLP